MTQPPFVCPFCGGDPLEPDHESKCDGRQGGVVEPPQPEDPPLFTQTLPLTKEGFLIYHATNPQVYAKLREFALQAKRAGRKYLSINMLHERVRWFTNIEAKLDTFKIGNNWRPFYARLLMEQEPELAGFFHTRKSVADDDDDDT